MTDDDRKETEKERKWEPNPDGSPPLKANDTSLAYEDMLKLLREIENGRWKVEAP